MDALRSPEVQYVLLIFGLFVVPKIFQRFRLPAAITSFALGAVSGLGFGWFIGDPTVGLMSTLGISALFLFAGLEVDFAALRRDLTIVVQHVIVFVVLLILTSAGLVLVFDLGERVAVLASLALLTPSAGFILSSLASMEASDGEKSWIKSKAIAAELTSLAALFVALQSTTATRLSFATLALGLLTFLLPVAFRLFARLVVPWAPRSEFAFLLMMAVVAAFVTRKLGVYYLVGAFIVGVVAQQLRVRLPAMSSAETLYAVEVFASFFVPFYFFNAGLRLDAAAFTWQAILLGVVFVVVMIPLRVGAVALHRHLIMKESWGRGGRVGLAMIPTLVFTLVIAAILRDQFNVAPDLFGALIVYTIINTIVPSFLLRLMPNDMVVHHGPLPSFKADESA